MSAPKRVKTAKSTDGRSDYPLPAVSLDYANGKRLATGASTANVALSDGLWYLKAETADCYVRVGDNTVQADGSAAGSRPLAAGIAEYELIEGGDQYIAYIRSGGSDGVLWAIPAKVDTQ